MKKNGRGIKVPNTLPELKYSCGIKVKCINPAPKEPQTVAERILRLLSAHTYEMFNCGITYEKDYSFWARAIPDSFLQKYDQLKDKTIEELKGKDISSFRRIKKFLRLASLQKKYDEGILDDEKEYLQYLRFRLRFPLEVLRNAKVSKKEKEEAEELLKQTDYMISLYQKDTLTILEKYLIEERNQEIFEKSMLKTSMEIGESLKRINAYHAAMERDFYNNKF